MERTARSLEELDALAAEFARGLRPRAGGATLVTLAGELGAGKTAFTKAVAKALGVSEVVNSPTFVLEKIYKVPAPQGGAGFTRLVHVDAYRLRNGAELAPLDFGELMKDHGNLVFLEWPENVSDALPTPAARLAFSVVGDARTVLYDA